MTIWSTSTLGKVAAVFNGKTPSKDEQRDEGHPVLKIRNVSEIGLFRGKFESFVDPALAEKHATKKVRAGDTLVLNAAHNTDYVASKTFRASPPTFGALATGEWLVIRPNELALDAGFTNHWINAAHTRAQLRELVNGIHLYPKDVARLKIPLPPLEEQRRIATILDQAETLRTQRRQALAHLDTLTQSLFLDMFGDPVANPKGWEKKPFGAVCETRLGKMLDAKQQTGANSRKYLRNANVQWFRIDTSDLLEMDFDAGARETFSLHSGDLLICEGGEPGRAAIWRGELEEIYYQKALHRGRPKSDLVNAEYLVWLLWFLSKRGGLGDYVTAATIAHLTGEKLKAMAIPIPPLPLQQTFATRIQAIEALKATHRAALAQLDALFASLQQRAFSGELTQTASATVPTRTKPDLSALCTLDVKKMLEAMIYVAKRMPGHDFYKSLKALYAGDRQHLEHHGCLIYGETYEALEHGPVPKAAYALTKQLEEAASSNLFAEDAAALPLRRIGNQLIPARDADFGLLSAAERKSLDWAIQDFAPMRFGETKTATHDSAYLATAPNAPIAIEAIIRTLPEAAQRRFFA